MLGPLEKLPNFSPKWLYPFVFSPAVCGHARASASSMMLVIVALLIAAIVVSVKGSHTLVIVCIFQLPINFKQLLSFASKHSSFFFGITPFCVLMKL